MADDDLSDDGSDHMIIAHYSPSSKTQIAKRTLASSMLMIVLDATWIGVNIGNYRSAVQSIQRGVPLDVRIGWVLFPYVCLIFQTAVATELLMRFVPPLDRPKLAVYAGLTLGFASYGVYSGTVAAIFSKYPSWLAFVDFVWGMVLFTATLSLAIRVN
eukprot:Clim_evm8s250 gene=Clim_evmTU8s250